MEYQWFGWKTKIALILDRMKRFSKFLCLIPLIWPCRIHFWHQQCILMTYSSLDKNLKNAQNLMARFSYLQWIGQLTFFFGETRGHLETFKWFSKKFYPWTFSQYAVKNDHFFTFCPPADQKIPRAKILSFLFVDPMGTYKCMLDGFGQDHSCGQKWPSKFHFIRIFQNFKRP